MSATLHVVVTGAGGFVGGYTTRWLAAAGHRVTATVRRSRPPTPLPAGVSVVAGDVRDPRLLPDRFDALIHCAAETPTTCPETGTLLASNVEAARVLFTKARAARAGAVVFLSSMSVYGEITVPIVTETLAPIDPDPYGRSKAEGEGLLEAAVAAGLPSGLSIRLPGTVGRGSHDNFLSGALARTRRGETLSGRHPEALFNNIVFVGDLARFLGTWIDAPRAGYMATNLAARDPLTFRALYTHLFACLGLPERIQYETAGKPPFLISVDRALALGYHGPTVMESVSAFVRDCLSAEAVPVTVVGR